MELLVNNLSSVGTSLQLTSSVRNLAVLEPSLDRVASKNLKLVTSSSSCRS
ncbi:hypothetical protein DPMN_075197 [Dreissena polymorpha]|uniref:Uncharacterized protein n=1 Tax=Dreissena polymorpha TaxID=45954 RepID=A0A9D3YJ39_DREPO|nr:hypothetical protein DPMN_075197 [Dreissena polymorpha]